MSNQIESQSTPEPRNTDEARLTVNYDSIHGKFFEFDLVSAGKVVLKRGN